MFQQEIEERHSTEAVEEEIRIFERHAKAWVRGEIPEDQFRRFRLKHGIYGQRQSGFQMVRVKIPSGVLNPYQLRVLATVAEKYSTGRGHVTTRENCQFHFVRMENVPAILRLLAQASLTTREACGNTVRNVTSCPLAGVCAQEAFDVTPYAMATSRFFLRHPEFSEMPRKFKIAFSGCDDDGQCAAAEIHDIGLIARIKPSAGGMIRGFKVLLGGGLGSLPTAAQTLTEFLFEEALIPTLEAVLRVFNEHGNRNNKHKARLKFVLREKGIEELRRLVFEERAKVKTSGELLERLTPVQPAWVQPSPGPVSGNGVAGGYQHWAQHNLRPQRQAGYGVVWITLKAGSVQAEQFRGLARLLEEHQLSALRIAISQDLVIPWVPLVQASKVHKELEAMGLATPGAGTVSDATGCPGATTCNLGITRSLSLAEVLADEFAGEQDPGVQKIRIKISGCPNSCGQHHLADIGLYGNARKIDNKVAPFYQLLLGGGIVAGKVTFARQVVPVPARRIPQALRALIDFYLSDRQPGESFHAWSQRIPDAAVIRRLRPFLGGGEEQSDLWVDWGDEQTYSLKLGRGECAE